MTGQKIKIINELIKLIDFFYSPQCDIPNNPQILQYLLLAY